MSQSKKKFVLGRGVKDIISGSLAQQTEMASFKNRKSGESPNGKSSDAKPGLATGATLGVPAKQALGGNTVSSPFQELPIDKISPAPNQSRENFDPVQLKELADSILAEGLMQPIVVREKDGGFQLIAGERRWRACKSIGLKVITARIVKASDASSAAMTLIENLQRANLNPIEEAFGIASLMRDFNLTQEALAERLGKARSSIANSLRLVSLDEEIRGYISTGRLSVGHAKVLLGIENAAERLLLARHLVETGKSVRDAEELAKKVKQGKSLSPNSANDTAPVIREISQEILRIERDLCSHLHTKVLVKHGKNSGKIVIEYHGNDDLARLLETFGLK